MLTEVIISILASITCRAGDTHFTLAFPRTAAQCADGSMWAAVTGPTEPRSAVHIKALFAGVTVKPLIAWLTLTLPCGLVAAIHIQASDHRAVTDVFCKGKKERDIH